MDRSRSAALFAHNRRFIPGGLVSLNRKVEPEIAFVRGKGAHVWDADGNRYLDYHAAFAPYLLGHADPEVEAAVRQSLDDGWTLMGSGTTPWEGQGGRAVPPLRADARPRADHDIRLRGDLSRPAPRPGLHRPRPHRRHAGRLQRLARRGRLQRHDAARTDRPARLPRRISHSPRSPRGCRPTSPRDVTSSTSTTSTAVAWAFEKYPVACLITEPILQNIGIVKPKPGYLEGLRKLCDQHGVVLVFDEVKTGFRHALGGYQSLTRRQAGPGDVRQGDRQRLPARRHRGRGSIS